MYYNNHSYDPEAYDRWKTTPPEDNRIEARASHENFTIPVDVEFEVSGGHAYFDDISVDSNWESDTYNMFVATDEQLEDFLMTALGDYIDKYYAQPDGMYNLKCDAVLTADISNVYVIPADGPDEDDSYNTEDAEIDVDIDELEDVVISQI